MTNDRPLCEPLALDAAPLELGAAMRARGFEQLTPIQGAVLAPDVSGRDLRIRSQTGSGKTVALGFVLASEVAAAGRDGRGRTARPVGLIVAPTRELASQLGRELSWLYEPLKAGVVAVTGGTSVQREREQLGRMPAVVVGTPGRLLDHLRRGSLALDALSSLVLDEADELLDMGFEEELEGIVGFAPNERRTHMVSATFRKDVTAVADRMQRSPHTVCADTPGEANADIDHVATVVHASDRKDAIVNILLRHPDDKTLIFVRTRADTQELSQALCDEGFEARALSGEMTHRERTDTFARFRSGSVRLLVATDVAARGLDVQDIARVIQADLPDNAEVFTHRSGRTGRAGRRGQNVVLATPGGRRRVEGLLRGAKVRARFEPPPSPEAIREAADERLREQLLAEGGEPEPRLRAVAERLLAEGDPTEVVARLLGRSEHAGPCEPRAIAPPSPKRKGDTRKDDARKGARAPAHRAPRDDEGFVTFQVSWGARNGADPRRLLALVCRRAGLRRHDVGAIRVAPKSSTVQVATPVVGRFEDAVRKPDARDPHVRFRRWQPRGARPAAQAGGR